VGVVLMPKTKNGAPVKKASRVLPTAPTGVPGRPPYQFTPEHLALIQQLGEIQCTDAEIAAALDVSVDTLTNRKASDPLFSDALKKARENGRKSLRRCQWELAQQGHPTMLIWLGKQILGQRDKHELTGAEGGPIQTATIPVEALPIELKRQIVAAVEAREKGTE
jgi:hypothetical protein